MLDSSFDLGRGQFHRTIQKKRSGCTPTSRQSERREVNVLWRTRQLLKINVPWRKVVSEETLNLSDIKGLFYSLRVFVDEVVAVKRLLIAKEVITVDELNRMLTRLDAQKHFCWSWFVR